MNLINKMKKEFDTKKLEEIDIYLFLKIMMKKKFSFINNSIFKEFENSGNYSINLKDEQNYESVFIQYIFKKNPNHSILYLTKNSENNTISTSKFLYPKFKNKVFELDYILRVKFDEKFEKINVLNYHFKYDLHSSFLSYDYTYDFTKKTDLVVVDYKIYGEERVKICEKLKDSKYLEETFFDDLDLIYDCNNDFFKQELKKSFSKESLFDKNEDLIKFILLNCNENK